MAYNLRYYKELQHADGSAVRLEIHEKNGTAPAIEIGSVLQTLRLDIQGGTDTIDVPIVKTSLTMAFVDAPDITDGKCGDWQEFYTPDSTKWKVLVKAKIPGASYVTIWGGYITPDSYSEQLTYRGSVSIIARDNIGHMQDFPFDLAGNTDGMITLRELLDAAWAKIESPMQLDFWHQEQEANYLRCNGIDAIDTYLNVSAFKEMNFCEAVEKALYSYGLVLRYVGRNIVSVMSLRDLPLQGRLQPLTVKPIFVAGAERELAPAARRIEETAKYEFGTGVQALLATSIDFTGAAGTCAFYSTNIFGETAKVNIPVHPIANTNTSNEGWSNFASSTLFFNPNRYVIRDAQLIDDANRLLFLAANTDGSHWVAYRKSIYCSPFRWEMTFGRVVTRQGNDVSYCYGFASGNEDNGIGSIKVKEVTCYVSIEQNGSSKYYDGAEWQAEPYKIILQPEENKVSLDLGFKDITGNAMVAITVENIEIDSMRDYSDGSGMYVPIQSLNFVPTDALSLCETNTVNTNYVDTNNVIISRDPEIAPALNEVPFPNVIKNGIFVKSGNAYLPAKKWAWSGGTPQQMAVYNHLQLLCYHAKPNNVITGDIVNTDFVYLERLYRWNGEDHILISGSYNFIDGVIESAVLRSFAWYSDMWSDVTGIDNSLEQNSKTVAEGSGQAAKTSAYRNESSVYLGEGGGGSIEVDNFLSTTSTNPVQNLVVTAALNDKINKANDVDFVLAEADGMVDSNDTHYYLPNINPEDKSHTFAMLSDIPEGGGGGSITIDTELSEISENAIANKTVTSALKDKQNTIEDLDAIRSGAGKGATSIQKVKTINEEPIEGEGNFSLVVLDDGLARCNGFIDIEDFKYFFPSERNSSEAETLATIEIVNNGLSTKQDIIEDIEGIRSGAAKGATAVQPESLAKVAISGSYNDLSNKPSIPIIPDNIYVKPSAGIPKSDLESSVQSSLDKADTAIQKVKTINGQSIVGEGNLVIEEGGGGGTSGDPSDLLTQISIQLDAVESLLDELNDSEIPLIDTINEINGEVI